MTAPTRWIERRESVLILSANPAEWTAEQKAELVSHLNCNGLRRAVLAALQKAADEREGKGKEGSAA